MYTLIIASCFAGFFALYNTSKKAKLSGSGNIEKWLQLHPARAKQLGLLLIILSIAAWIAKDGWGIGGFSAFLLIMTVASIVVAIAPMQYVHIHHLAFLTAVCFLFELIIF